MINDPLKCDATGKRRYPTPGDAKKTLLSKLAHNKYKNRSKKAAGKSSMKRYYYCSHCKGFHLTSADYINKNKFKKMHQEFKQKSKGLIVSQEEALLWKKDSLPFPKIQSI
jgi:hypothetical protein